MENTQKSSTLTSAKRRTKGLKKKILEFTTLCNVEACMVLFGSRGKVETWPEDRRKLHQTIEKYLSKRSEQKEKNIYNISSFKDYATMKTMESDKESVESLNLNPSSFNAIDHLSKESLRDLEKTVQSRLKEVQEKIELLKSKTVNQTTSDKLPDVACNNFGDHDVHGSRDFTGNDVTYMRIGPASYAREAYDEIDHQSPPPISAMPKLLQLFPLTPGY